METLFVSAEEIVDAPDYASPGRKLTVTDVGLFAPEGVCAYYLPEADKKPQLTGL